MDSQVTIAIISKSDLSTVFISVIFKPVRYSVYYQKKTSIRKKKKLLARSFKEFNWEI